MVEKVLPEGWMDVKFGEIVLYQKGKKPSVLKEEEFKDSLPYLDIKALERGEIRQYAEISSSIILNENDIAIVWDGARCGWVAFGQTGSLGSTLGKITPVLCNRNLIFYFLKKQFSFLNTNTTGIGIPHLNGNLLWNTPFPLSPLPDQQRIAEKLDRLMGFMHEAQIALELVPLILQQFRQKVLAMAVRGDLSKEWREQNNNIFYIEEYRDKSRDKNNWLRLKANEACSVVQNGITPKGKPFTAVGDIPFLKVYNIVNQEIDFDFKPQFIPLEVHQKEAKRSIAYPNDVVMNIVGPPLGKVAIVSNQYPEWNMNQAVTLFRCKKFLLPKFLYFILCEGSQIQAIANDYRGVAGQSNISLSQCRNFDFYVPSLPEQNVIIRKINHLFFIADSIESEYETAKSELISLPHAILSMAFSGGLTAPVKNTVNAIALLDRIREEKTRLEGMRKEKPKSIHEIKSKKFVMSTNLTIKDILQKTPGLKIPIKKVLEQSKYNKTKDSSLDMDGFYDELKTLIPFPVKEIRESGEIYLILEHHAH